MDNKIINNLENRWTQIQGNFHLIEVFKNEEKNEYRYDIIDTWKT